MSTWGPKLYQDDLADDVKEYYKDQLRRGKSSDEITRDLVEQYSSAIADADDASVFWFALADTQWNLGRLEDTVKQKALYYIDAKYDLSRWSQAEPRELKIRQKVIEDLKNKLLSPQTKEIPVSQYKIYHCDWKNGDVFAYKLCGKFAESTEMFNNYIYFVKICNDTWWPGHTVPVVYFYWITGKEVLGIDEIKNCRYIPQFYNPTVYINNPDTKKLYLLELLSTSSRVIPQKQLTFLGNLGDVERIKDEEESPYPVKWKDLEKYIIGNFLKWEKYKK